MCRKHFKCLLWKILWGAAVLSLIAAWVSIGTGAVLGLNAQFWFWNSLIFVLLSSPVKMDCSSCGMCGMEFEEEIDELEQ